MIYPTIALVVVIMINSEKGRYALAVIGCLVFQAAMWGIVLAVALSMMTSRYSGS
jgi:hypothetical protein